MYPVTLSKVHGACLSCLSHCDRVIGINVQEMNDLATIAKFEKPSSSFMGATQTFGSLPKSTPGSDDHRARVGPVADPGEPPSAKVERVE